MGVSFQALRAESRDLGRARADASSLRVTLVSLAPADLLTTVFPAVRWGNPLKHTDVKNKTQYTQNQILKWPRIKSKIAREKMKFTGLPEEQGIRACPAEMLDDRKSGS